MSTMLVDPTLDDPCPSPADLRYLALAARQARTAQSPRYHLGAIIVRSGRVLSTGANRLKNTPSEIIPRSAWSTHAEEDCIRQLPEKARGRRLTMYVARVNRQGEWRLARPCQRCWTSAVNAGVTRIVYSTNTGIAVEHITGRTAA